MDESELKNEKENEDRRFDPELLKKGLRCDLDQYEMLKRCSEKKDMKEWNEWRKKNPHEDILLEGAFLWQTHLVGANLSASGLQNAEFYKANLQGTDLLGANLKNGYFEGTNLKGADFSRAIVDGRTLIWGCEVDKYTKFEGVGLGNMRIYPALKQLLEYNIRRMNWQAWYEYKDWDKICPKEERNKMSQILRQSVQWFWAISDYGRSTGRIIFTFFGLALVFALVYCLWPDCVMVNNVVGDMRGLWHALYFSVVTMTTLGLGDIAANPDSWCGQTLLMLQVILGYVLLGALVTRFAVLFTAVGPAGKFTNKKRNATEGTEQQRENKYNL